MYKVLDPKFSILTQVQQFFSSLLTCSEGSGRLLLLWFNSGYPTFEDFCLGEPAKTRELRRVFLLASAWCFRRHVKYLNSEQFQLTLCGDSNADTGTMDQFFQTWDRKKHCCVSSGICKEMKKMGVTSNDLKTRKWRQTMYHTAATLQLSMADVEAMHSRNRVLARSAFHSIASKFINKECKSFYEEAQVLQGCKSSETSCLNQDFKKDGLQVISQKPYQKGQSALELFRHRYLKGKMASESFNPCSKEVWNEVKDSYNSLPQDENLHRSCVLTGGLCFMDWAPPNRHQTLHFGPKRNHAILMDSWLTGGTKKINHKAMQV